MIQFTGSAHCNPKIYFNTSSASSTLEYFLSVVFYNYVTNINKKIEFILYEYKLLICMSTYEFII
jgi:hypothetical protein